MHRHAWLYANICRSFYKHLLGMAVDFGDIEATEPDYYKVLKQILEHSLEEVFMDDLTFSAEIQKFGRTEVSTYTYTRTCTYTCIAIISMHYI